MVADLGVVLLLFGLGLELSLDRVRKLWKPVVFGGTLQVGLTILLAAGIASLFGMTLRPALFLGCFAAACSSIDGVGPVAKVVRQAIVGGRIDRTERAQFRRGRREVTTAVR